MIYCKKQLLNDNINITIVLIKTMFIYLQNVC